MTPTEVVLDNLRLANNIARRYMRDRPQDTDDILSAAYFGLVEASHKRNPRLPYIKTCIVNSIRSTISKRNTLCRSDRRFLARYLEHEGNIDDRAQSMGLTSEYVFRRLNRMLTIEPLSGHHDIACKPESQLGELLEVCLQYIPPSLHTPFLLKYKDNLRTNDICETLGKSRRWVETALDNAIQRLKDSKSQIAELVF